MAADRSKEAPSSPAPTVGRTTTALDVTCEVTHLIAKKEKDGNTFHVFSAHTDGNVILWKLSTFKRKEKLEVSCSSAKVLPFGRFSVNESDFSKKFALTALAEHNGFLYAGWVNGKLTFWKVEDMKANPKTCQASFAHSHKTPLSGAITAITAVADGDDHYLYTACVGQFPPDLYQSGTAVKVKGHYLFDALSKSADSKVAIEKTEYFADTEIGGHLLNAYESGIDAIVVSSNKLPNGKYSYKLKFDIKKFQFPAGVWKGKELDLEVDAVHVEKEVTEHDQSLGRLINSLAEQVVVSPVMALGESVDRIARKIPSSRKTFNNLLAAVTAITGKTEAFAVADWEPKFFVGQEVRTSAFEKGTSEAPPPESRPAVVSKVNYGSRTYQLMIQKIEQSQSKKARSAVAAVRYLPDYVVDDVPESKIQVKPRPLPSSHTIGVWKIDENGKPELKNTFGEHYGGVNALLVSNGCLYSASNDKSVVVWRLTGREEVQLTKIGRINFPDAVASMVTSQRGVGRLLAGIAGIKDDCVVARNLRLTRDNDERFFNENGNQVPKPAARQFESQFPLAHHREYYDCDEELLSEGKTAQGAEILHDSESREGNGFLDVTTWFDTASLDVKPLSYYVYDTPPDAPPDAQSKLSFALLRLNHVCLYSGDCPKSLCTSP